MLLLLLASLAYLYYRSRALSHVPGPWLSRFTSLTLKYHEFRGRRREYIHALHRWYGPAVRLAPNEASFTSLEAVKEVYAAGGSGYDKTEYYSLFCQFGIRTMFSTLNKEEHRRRKRILAERYTMTNVMREPLLEGIQERARAFTAKCANSVGSVDIYALLHCYALDCVTHFLFGDGLDSLCLPANYEIMAEMTYHQSLQKNLLHYYLPRIAPYLPFCQPRHAPLANEYVIGAMKKKVDQEASSKTQQHESYSLIDRLLSSMEGMPAAAECKDHMAAGIDTTGDALCFAIWQLSKEKHSHVQTKLKEELREHYRSDQAGDLRSLDRLPYLDAVIKETLRLTPPIPMSLPRYAPGGKGKSNVVIDGYAIPAGTIVSSQAYSVHRLNQDVFPESDRFTPDRWLGDALDQNRLFFAFGQGSRGCTGRNLATMEMKILLAEVYLRFSTINENEDQMDMELDDQIISARPRGQMCKVVFT
ncbi:hypothetical protein ASPZODRAFT_16346 [Penicilliopsis zonata CBS 506.65]|uniref:Cytochrome P450 monooxygenase n=1 Tax=Penicilliopsis zonata CBS 506.65 TaxID=1073090 RepID=A0A1L9SHS6_9EURO|nr:hypothetical protein ASPZODRAFT_16346 [Penicilliopsis zonata CBS 506.65]OJJ46594.1 hypothetical protein ASPZODRAFT_16346 [Penicilliopsis zonata CBS 506.65]